MHFDRLATAIRNPIRALDDLVATGRLLSETRQRERLKAHLDWRSESSNERDRVKPRRKTFGVFG